MRHPLTIALLGATLASCATIPAPLQGEYAATTPREARQMVSMPSSVPSGKLTTPVFGSTIGLLS